MAKFAPVAPVQILHQMVDEQVFGDYHLFLAHHTVERGDEFRALMRKLYVRPRAYSPPIPLTIIMDNSIVELGGSVDDQMISDAVSIVKYWDGERTPPVYSPRVIPVLPDVMGDGKGTIELTRQAYARWQAKKMPGDKYMLVTQGAHWQDYVELVDHFFIKHSEHYTDIHWVGIPRWMETNWQYGPTFNARAEAVRYIQMVAPHISIHLLGFSRHMLWDLQNAKMPGVAGIDSAVPVRCNFQIRPHTTEQDIGPRKPDWFRNGELSKVNVENINLVRKWVG